MAIVLPKLPYDLDALEPHMSKQTLDFHYGKHHKTYVDKANKLLEDSELKDAPLEEIVMRASGTLFNNAAQVWNHNFFWNCLAPAPAKPDKAVQAALSKAFGSFDAFMDQFSENAVSLFGSGWTWLVRDSDGSLEIVKTSNAASPLTDHRQPLLVCDVWEHAYYIDHRNDRLRYLQNYWQLVNWDFVAANFGDAPAPRRGRATRATRATHAPHRGVH